MSGIGGHVNRGDRARRRADLAEWLGTFPPLDPPTPEPPEFDPDDASTYPCAYRGDCGCTGTGLLSCPGWEVLT